MVHVPGVDQVNKVYTRRIALIFADVHGGVGPFLVTYLLAVLQRVVVRYAQKQENTGFSGNVMTVWPPSAQMGNMWGPFPYLRRRQYGAVHEKRFHELEAK